MQDPEEERVRSGRGEFARVGETISFVLVGGISVLYVLVGREGEVKGPGIWLVPRSVGGSPWVNGL
jgi:hypothetical protein